MVLPHDKFIRVHKSYILAIDRIISISGSEFLIERKNKQIDIPVGIMFKKNVLKRLNIS
jgi:DNA-binding LytR/AlgR family response regulator